MQANINCRKEAPFTQISEVAREFGLTTDTLRYYEKEGLIGPVSKGENGIRNYTEDDIKEFNL